MYICLFGSFIARVYIIIFPKDPVNSINVLLLILP